MTWKRISLLLCVFGFLKEFRPSEPFVTEYLTGPWKNFTETQVTQEIYPVGTYSYMATLVAVFLVTDLVRYKPVIILCGITGSCTYITLILAQSIWEMEIVQFLIGLFLASEVAYFTYIYAKVSKLHYQEVTSYTRTAILLGRFTASVASQLTVSLNVLNYHQLNYLTLSALILATIWALFLPSVSQSIYFHRPMDAVSNESSAFENEVSRVEHAKGKRSHSQQNLQFEALNKNSSLTIKVKNAYYLLWNDFLAAYSNFYVLKWSIWWSFATCGYTQVINYVQLLWQDSLEGEDIVYNAGVEAVYTILGALTAFGVGKLRLNWPAIGEATLSIFALLQGSSLIVASQTYNIWLSYTIYVIFGLLYQAMITIASSEVAKNLSEDSYGLIFGVNTLIALLLQSLLTFVVTGKNVLALPIRAQYLVYGGFFIALGVVFFMIAVFTTVVRCKNGKRFLLWQPSETSNSS
nr:thiamine transporter 2-like isoform X1 [Neodiprion pinetum]XP_046480175.1 thiamine transporter 2-like isoform X1 [Neodiprion pinetum]XP_046480177.1 thiamine transporter 2-like isoform X1 [Neodiprion pinetum]